MPRGALAWDKVAGESICGNNRGCGVSSDPFRESKGRALELGSGGQRQAGFNWSLGVGVLGPRGERCQDACACALRR